MDWQSVLSRPGVVNDTSVTSQTKLGRNTQCSVKCAAGWAQDAGTTATFSCGQDYTYTTPTIACTQSMRCAQTASFAL